MKSFYTALAAAILLASAARADTWQTVTATSPIDDSQNVQLTVMSDERIEDHYGLVKGHPLLMAQCKENRTEVLLNMAGLFEALDATTVTMRLDSEPAQRTAWERSTDGFWLYYEAGSPIDLIERFARHHSLYIEWSPYGDGRYSAHFQLDTLAGVLLDLQKACHWTAAETSARKVSAAKAKAAADAKATTDAKAAEDAKAAAAGAPLPPALQSVIDSMKGN